MVTGQTAGQPGHPRGRQCGALPLNGGLRVKEDGMPLDKFISSDGHLVEPDDLWVTRMDQRFRDRAPQPKMVNGEKTWIIEGALTVSTENAWVKAEQAKHEPALDLEGRHKTARPARLDPHFPFLD